MSVHPCKTADGTRYQVRWRESNGRVRTRSLTSKREANAFDADVKARKYKGGRSFPAPTVRCGSRWQFRNWRRRVWRPILQQLADSDPPQPQLAKVIPYDCRGSFVSLHLRAGENPLEVAQWAGHSPQVMFEHYAIKELAGEPVLPAAEQIARAREAVAELDRNELDQLMADLIKGDRQHRLRQRRGIGCPTQSFAATSVAVAPTTCLHDFNSLTIVQGCWFSRVRSRRPNRGREIMARVSLTELIAQVTNELRLAAAAAEDADHVMRFKDCELEMAVSVENEGGGGVRIHIVELGGKRTKTNSNTIRVRFTNLPERPIVLTAIQAEQSSPDEFPTG